MGLGEKLFGTHSERELKKIEPIIKKIEDLDEAMQALSDDEFVLSFIISLLEIVVCFSISSFNFSKG